MNIQIFGKAKCFDTKKAERWFKERRIKYQYIDLSRVGISRGELKSVLGAVKSLDALLDEKHPDAPLFQHLAYRQAQEDMLFEQPLMLKTPVVRNGKQATVGFEPDVWVGWV